MSLEIFVMDESAPIPRPTALRLTCDGGHPAGVLIQQQFDCDGGYIPQMAAAMREGWLERQTSQGRIFLCPLCSKKKMSA